MRKNTFAVLRAYYETVRTPREIPLIFEFIICVLTLEKKTQAEFFCVWRARDITNLYSTKALNKKNKKIGKL